MSSLGGPFPSTHVSAIAGARSDEEAVRRRSWDAIVAAYWKPAYKHARLTHRRSSDDAADLVQGFFEHAMEKDFFASYEPERARFRTFFRVCLDRFAANEHRATSRLKRGGAASVLSLDWPGAEDELARAAPTALSPEQLFDREWRRSLFGLAIEALERDARERGREAAFEAFRRYDLAEGERPTYDALAQALGVPATTITNHLATMRRELRRILLARLGELTSTPAELESEARLLLPGD